MADSRKTQLFGDCAVRVKDTVHPENAHGMPYIGLEHITEGTLSLNGWGDASDVISNKARFQKGDILFGKLRPYFRKVVVAPFDGVCSTDIWVVRSQPGIDQRFLYYIMASLEFVEQATRASEGTKMPRAKWDYLEKLEYSIPPLPEQKAIAHVLGTLDDKIELNRRMNETLEAMARAIFKSWFVDFDPVRAKSEGRDTGLPKEISDFFPDSFVDSELGEIPKGWEVGKLGDICEVTIGGDWGKDDEFTDSVGVYCLRGVDIFDLRNSGTADAPIRCISKSSLEKRALCEEDILISASGLGPLGRCLWACDDLKNLFDKPIIYANFCKRFRAKTKFHGVYIERILLDMRQSSEIWEYSSGTALPNLDSSGLLNGKLIVIPSQLILETFFKIVSPNIRMLYNNESNYLSMLRDSLLPKLISGEVRTS
jgi:type I restriction enzyme S subunit